MRLEARAVAATTAINRPRGSPLPNSPTAMKVAPVTHTKMTTQVRRGSVSFQTAQAITAAMTGAVFRMTSTLPAAVFFMPTTNPRVLMAKAPAQNRPLRPHFRISGTSRERYRAQLITKKLIASNRPRQNRKTTGSTEVIFTSNASGTINSTPRAAMVSPLILVVCNVASPVPVWWFG